MSATTTDTHNFLSLHATLERVILFAEASEYVKPSINRNQVSQFHASMKLLFLQSEQLQVLPNVECKHTIEVAAEHYATTQNCLITLYLSSPDPAQAKGWFDYQKEFNAREQYQKDLMLLMDWHLTFFEELINIAPPLIVPPLAERLPDSENRKDEDSQSTIRNSTQDLYL